MKVKVCHIRKLKWKSSCNILLSHYQLLQDIYPTGCINTWGIYSFVLSLKCKTCGNTIFGFSRLVLSSLGRIKRGGNCLLLQAMRWQIFNLICDKYSMWQVTNMQCHVWQICIACVKYSSHVIDIKIHMWQIFNVLHVTNIQCHMCQIQSSGCKTICKQQGVVEVEPGGEGGGGSWQGVKKDILDFQNRTIFKVGKSWEKEIAPFLICLIW